MQKNFGIIIGLFLLWSITIHAQDAAIVSPNNKLKVVLNKQPHAEKVGWSLQILYTNNNEEAIVIPQINLGLVRSDQDFSYDLKLIGVGKAKSIQAQYTALFGKRKVCSNAANELILKFESAAKAKMNVVLRAYNDGITFRYEFPDKKGVFKVEEERTSYQIPDNTKRWLEKFNPANEGLYSTMSDANSQQEWGYPALFNASADKNCWYLIHEADLDETYCGTKLSNQVEKSQYKLTFPSQGDGRGQGESKPTITLPWKSPWRVVIVGSLADIVESTLIDDVSPASVVENVDWIKPGKASWNYWSNNHGTMDFKVVREFADLAASMGWPYTLLDWEWDRMSNGGNLYDALKYIKSLGLKPLMWYNSGGEHTWVNSTPKDRMLTHESRVEEFKKLNDLGVVGVKIDFFESEKQSMIKYYLDILKDAATYHMMVYFHGCLVPRGWARTYPNLMTYEGVRGAEWYNNGPEFTNSAPEHNTILPFTRNVVGSMDYTPVTFTNSQYPHVTSYAHELALSVVFESGIQHMADRPEGYYSLPEYVKTFLKEVPNAWDNTKLLDGYPGKDLMLARQKDACWYIGGLNAEQREKNKKLDLAFLKEGMQYQLTLIADGAHDKSFISKNLVVNRSSIVDVKLLRRGGFVAVLKPMNP